jgi:hypothetical protein
MRLVRAGRESRTVNAEPVVIPQEYELVPAGRLSLHPDNPRKGDLDALGESISANGFYGAVIVQRSTGRIIAGNHRYQALIAAASPDELVPVIWADVDDDRARRILAADNRTGDLATYDQDALLALLEEMAGGAAGLVGTGFDLDDLEDLRAIAGTVAEAGPDGTGAGYAETQDEEDERVDRLGGNSYTQQGLRELVVVLPAERHADAVARIAELRKAAPENITSGEIVLAALLAAPRGVCAPAEAAA